MAEKSINIIGAGIAGLSAGFYARINGYKTTIFELHDKPGGLSASWKRKDYTFAGCIEWLVGSSPASQSHKIWKELGALGDRPVYNHEIFRCFEDEQGRVFNIYTNLDKLESHMLEISPQDQSEIKSMIKAVRKLCIFDVTPSKNPFKTWLNAMSMLSGLGVFKTYGLLSLGDLGARFQNPLLRNVISNIFRYTDYSALGFLFTLAYLHLGTAGFPQGGSMMLVPSIEARYKEIEGKIRYKAKVRRVSVQNHRAVGVELDDGESYESDYVISAADGRSTLDNMLGGTSTTPELKNIYETWPIVESNIIVSLCVNRDMSCLPHTVGRFLSQPISFAGRKYSTFCYRHYSFDPTFAPRGKAVIDCAFYSDYDYWDSLGYGTLAYIAEKEKVLEICLGQLEKFLPGIRSQIEVSDVATPLTFNRYTGNYKGSSMGFRCTPQNAKYMIKGLDKSLPGLANFYMVGQWT